MKKLILSLSIFTTLLSCKKENIVYYKYAYIHEQSVQDSARIKIITTHLRPYKTILTDSEINQELKQIRLNKPKYVLIDTLVMLENNNNLNNIMYNNLKKQSNENKKTIN